LVIAASWYGKIKTLFQIIAIVLFIIIGSDWVKSLDPVGYNLYQSVAWLFMGAALFLTIMSMAQYFRNAAKVIKGPWNRPD
jgi:phosphatidylglycerophosphate synthase